VIGGHGTGRRKGSGYRGEPSVSVHGMKRATLQAFTRPRTVLGTGAGAGEFDRRVRPTTGTCYHCDRRTEATYEQHENSKRAVHRYAHLYMNCVVNSWSQLSGIERCHQHPLTANNRARAKREPGVCQAGDEREAAEAVTEKVRKGWFSLFWEEFAMLERVRPSKTPRPIHGVLKRSVLIAGALCNL